MNIEKGVHEEHTGAPPPACESETPASVCAHAWPDPVRGARQTCEECGTTRYTPNWLLTDKEFFGYANASGNRIHLGQLSHTWLPRSAVAGS